jgi:ribosomal protein RSM22 (predicted rRNA methylase)
MNDALNALKEILKSELENLQLNPIKQSRSDLTSKYRENRPKVLGQQKFMQTHSERLAYLTTRMPATGAVIHRVLQEIKLHQPDLQIESLLDLGAGPGTSLWAFSGQFCLSKASLIEQDPELIKLGQRLAQLGSSHLCQNISWKQENLLSLNSLDTHDCVIMSYVLNELPPKIHPNLIEDGWNLAKKNLIIIEPGTPHGYQIILAARQLLISLGAHIVAPCPHAATCPLSHSQKEWCHFSERLQRSREHRLIKDARLGYEDEKYSYIIASKENSIPYNARILNHPQKRSGHVHVELCTEHGAVNKIISKKDGEAYKCAKKLNWGDTWMDRNRDVEDGMDEHG